MGSFVPAERAVVGVVDRLFARVGASDNVARHMSTFHMEMTETANILSNATSQSFVILDEIGALLRSLPGQQLFIHCSSHVARHLTSEKRHVYVYVCLMYGRKWSIIQQCISIMLLHLHSTLVKDGLIPAVQVYKHI